MGRPSSLDAFASQTRVQHLATVVGGMLVCLVAYFGAVAAVHGDLSLLANESNVTAQRTGGVVAGVAVWGYFAVAFVRGYGGPVLNTLPYPLFITLLVPFPARWTLFGPDLPGLWSRFVGLFVVEPLITALLVAVPGLTTYALILGLWASRLDEADRAAWEERHLTGRFRAKYVDVE